MNLKLFKTNFNLLFLILIIFSPSVYATSIQTIPLNIEHMMEKTTWHKNCPVPIKNLRLLTLPYWGFDHRLHRDGQLIVNQSVATEVLTIFNHLAEIHFPIYSMKLIENFNGNDDASDAADNTSAFNCRPMTGTTTKWSLHSYGLAIDINPLENPYVNNGHVLDPHAKRYINRQHEINGMIRTSSVIYQLFIQQGWKWGGNWKNPIDYQHFEKH